MQAADVPIQYLLTLPPRMAEEFEGLEHRKRPEWFAGCDPAGIPLGSGGGTANLLAEAWRATGAGQTFSGWLGTNRKLILHTKKQNRRLPTYTPTIKLLIPIPIFR